MEYQAYCMSEEDFHDIENMFTYHPPLPGQNDRYETLRRLGKELATEIMVFCPKSRETSLAITKIEEAIMWANASIARNEKG